MTRKKRQKKPIYKISLQNQQGGLERNLPKINYKLDGHKIFTYEKVARQ